MLLKRRDFLRLIAGAAGAGAVAGCGRLWRVPDRLVELAQRGPGMESRLNTICGLCESGCGMTVRLVDGLPVGLKGNPRHPLNRGGLCPVGQAGLEVLYAPNRLTGPVRRGGDGRFKEVTWEEALDEIGGRLAELLANDGGARFALLSDEPGELFHQLATRFAGALGSANVARAADLEALPYRLAQGLDRVPGLDLAHADAVLAVGLDLFEDGATPLHAISALVGSRATGERAALLQVGSRLSPSATKAEQRIAVLPGTHAAAALGIAHVLVREGRYDARFVAEHTFGFDDWTDDDGRRRPGFRRLLLERYYPDRAAQLAGCDPGAIIRMARRLARAEAPLAVCGGEATATANATWTVLAVQALNALLGAFDRPGGVVLPPPIPFSEAQPVPGKARAGELFAAAEGLAVDPAAALAGTAAGDLEALFVCGSNPLHESPLGGKLRAALARIPLVVSFSPFLDETAAAADFVLPASLALESWSESTTPPGTAFSVLGVSQPVIEPLYETRHPGDVLLALAQRVGGPAAAALPWESYKSYLQERLEGLVVSGQGAVISGSFEESWVHFLEERGWRFLERNSPGEFWQDLTREGGWWNPVHARADWQRLFPTATGRYEFFSLALEQHLRQLGGGRAVGRRDAVRLGAEKLRLEATGDEACLPHYEPPRLTGEGELTLVPFRPITGRGRLGVTSPMVLEMYGYPSLTGWRTWVELAPETAHELHLEEGDLVALESEQGSIETVVRVEPGATPGVAHVPLGLGHEELAGPARGIGENPIGLLPPLFDPLSGTPALTATRVRPRLVARRGRGGPRPLTGAHG
jgi:anaerobic selenocysteine-containing dehydrogenase